MKIVCHLNFKIDYYSVELIHFKLANLLKCSVVYVLTSKYMSKFHPNYASAEMAQWSKSPSK